MNERFQITSNAPDGDDVDIYETYDAALDALALYAGRNLQSGDAVAFENEHTLHLFLHEYGPDPRRREHYTLRVERVIETVDLETAVQQAGEALPYSARAPLSESQTQRRRTGGGQCMCQKCTEIRWIINLCTRLGTTVAAEFGSLSPSLTIAQLRNMRLNLRNRVTQMEVA